MELEVINLGRLCSQVVRMNKAKGLDGEAAVARLPLNTRNWAATTKYRTY